MGVLQRNTSRSITCESLLSPFADSLKANQNRPFQAKATQGVGVRRQVSAAICHDAENELKKSLQPIVAIDEKPPGIVVAIALPKRAKPS